MTLKYMVFQCQATQLHWLTDRLHKKDVWKFSTTVSGEQCVMMDSLTQQQRLSATPSDLGVYSMTHDTVNVSTLYSMTHDTVNVSMLYSMTHDTVNVSALYSLNMTLLMCLRCTA